MLNELRARLKIKMNEKLSIEETKDYESISDVLKDDECFKLLPIEVAYWVIKKLGYSDDELDKVYANIMFDCSKKEYIYVEVEGDEKINR